MESRFNPARISIRFLAILSLLSLMTLGESPIRATEEEPETVANTSFQDYPAFNKLIPKLSGPEPVYGFRQIGFDAKYLFTRPFHMERKGRIKAAATAGTVLALYLVRDGIREKAQEQRNESRNKFLQGVRTMGKGAFAPSLALVSYLSSFITHNNREKETAFLLMESMVFTGVITAAGQYILATERPEDGDDIHFFRSGSLVRSRMPQLVAFGLQGLPAEPPVDPWCDREDQLIP